MTRLASLAAAALLSLLSSPSAQAQGDGARNYQLVPDGSRSFTVFGIFARGNQAADPSAPIQGAEVDAYLSVLQYMQAFSVGGRQLQAFALLPFGEANGNAQIPGRGTVSVTNSGLADAQVGAMLGLIGAPALSASEYASYQPGFTLGALAKLYMPTGEYDASRPLNLGTNRWALQLGAPMVKYLGQSMLDPSLTSLEFSPSISFFTNNNEPFRANTRHQDPLAKFEAHVTHNLTSSFWISADAFHVRGGETITDGVRDNNSQHWWGLGGTAGFSLTDALSGALTYGKVVRRNPTALEAQAVRADLMFAF